MFSSEYVDKVKKANKLEDIIREDGVVLVSKGNDFEGAHGKHTSITGTSLKVLVDKQLYKCFNCDEGGDVIGWLKKNRNMDYVEAVRYLAERAGMALPDMKPEEIEKYNSLRAERAELRKLHSRIATIYNKALTPEKYELLESVWGIKKDTVDALKIGYVPVEFQYTYNKLLAEGFSEEIILKSGLVKNDKHKSDAFVGRISIPYSSNEQAVYFAFRETKDTPQLGDKTSSKYKKLTVHSDKNPHVSETVKNNHLYGVDSIKGKKDILITEGLFDCVSAVKAGFHAISLGTVILSKEVEPKLISLVKGKDVTIVFDSEKTGTGEREALKLATILEENEIESKIVILPRPDGVDKVDLADFLKENKPEDLKALINNAGSAFDIYIDKLEQNPKNKEIREKIIELIPKKDKLIQDECKKKLSNILKPIGIGMKTIHEAVNESKKKQKKDTNSEKKEKKSVTVNMNNVELLFDERNAPHAIVPVKWRRKLMHLNSREFKNWIFHTRSIDGESTSETQYNQIINDLWAKCWDKNKKNAFYLRIAKHEGAFYYHLANSNDELVKITEGNWEIINNENAGVYFYRYANTAPQVTPNPNGDIRRLLNFVNIKDKGLQLLYLTCIVSYLIEGIPHPIMVVHGTQGSSKSTFSKMSRMIVDPAIAVTFRRYYDNKEFVQHLAHNHLVILDNLSKINQYISDMICSAVTGDGDTKRELFTNDDDIIYQYRRCLILNGINCAAVKPDLLRRSVLFKLESIPPNERKEESQLWEEFEQEKCFIFGGVLNTLAKAMELYPSVKLSEYSSMADFTRWGCAISQAMGYTTDDFMSAYKDNIKMQNEEALNSNEVADLLYTLAFQKKKWEGTAHELLTELNIMADAKNINTRGKAWPQSPNILSRQLNLLIPTLESFGVIIDRSRANSSRKISLEMKEKTSEFPTIKYTINPVRDDSSDMIESIVTSSSLDNRLESIDNTRCCDGDDSDDTFGIFSSSNSESNSNILEGFFEDDMTIDAVLERYSIVEMA